MRASLALLLTVAPPTLAAQGGHLAHFVAGKLTFVQGGVQREWPLVDPGVLDVKDQTHDTALTLSYAPIDGDGSTHFAVVYVVSNVGEHAEQLTLSLEDPKEELRSASYSWVSPLGPPRCKVTLSPLSGSGLQGSGQCSPGALGAGHAAVTQFTFSALSAVPPSELAPAVAPGPLARRPATLDQIPILPGSARTRPRPHDDLTGPDYRYFVTSAAIEDVVRFYREKLAPREAGQDDDAFQAASDALKPGGTTPVFLKLVPYDFANLGPLTQPTRAAVTKRSPYRAGQWLGRAQFDWALKRSDGTGTALAVVLEDLLQPQGTTALEFLNTGTLIHFSSADLSAETATETQDSEPAADQPPPPRAPRRAEHPPLPEPTSAQLGMPKYPGSQYDAIMSSQLSTDDRVFYVYTSGDQPQQAVAFYERATGKKAESFADAGAMIAVKGDPPFPELGVAIQPRLLLYPASVKTVITITQARR